MLQLLERIRNLWFPLDRAKIDTDRALIDNNQELIDDLSTLRYLVAEEEIYQQIKDEEYKRLIFVLNKRKRNLFFPYVAASLFLLLSATFFIVLSIEDNRQTEPTLLVSDIGVSYGRDEILDRFIKEQKTGVFIDSSGILNYTKVLSSDVENKRKVDNMIKVPTGETFSLVLNDGTKVWLNSESELHFPTVFSTKNRDVYLEGEGYFEVASDTSRQFRVHLNGAKILVYGTTFNVNTYENHYYATLLKGSIAMSNKSNTYKIKPGEQAIFSCLNQDITKRQVDVEEIICWKDGLFVFKDCRLEELMNQLERWYGIDVVYRANYLRDIKFRGDLSKDLQLDEIIGLLTETTPIRIDRNKEYLTISSKELKE